MATRNQTIESTWEEVVATGDEFLLQVPFDKHVYFAFADTAPSEALVGHVLNDRQALLRNSQPGNLYCKAPTGQEVVVIISDYTPA